MDKQAFITKLMTMYPSQFAGLTCDDWVREYEIALNADYEINFDKLWETIRNESPMSSVAKLECLEVNNMQLFSSLKN